jgi:hypothetical protein
MAAVFVAGFQVGAVTELQLWYLIGIAGFVFGVVSSAQG